MGAAHRQGKRRPGRCGLLSARHQTRPQATNNNRRPGVGSRPRAQGNALPPLGGGGMHPRLSVRTPRAQCGRLRGLYIPGAILRAVRAARFADGMASPDTHPKPGADARPFHRTTRAMAARAGMPRLRRSRRVDLQSPAAARRCNTRPHPRRAGEIRCGRQRRFPRQIQLPKPVRQIHRTRARRAVPDRGDTKPARHSPCGFPIQAVQRTARGQEHSRRRPGRNRYDNRPPRLRLGILRKRIQLTR